MQKMSDVQMGRVQGGSDCIQEIGTGAVIGTAIGSFGGFAGALGGAIIGGVGGYLWCQYAN
jgi:hypothetical protein